MAESRRHHRTRSVVDALLADLVSDQLGQWQHRQGSEEYTVVDLGGGTGTFAITLAEAGHPVTVVDPSLDALASLQRRTAERGLGDRLRGVQGDAADLLALLGRESTDVMICHRTLEVMDDPAAALTVMAEVVRPTGMLSVVVPQRRSVVLTRALQGQVGAAVEALDDPGRFDLDDIIALIERAGFKIGDIDGVGALAQHVPQSVIDSEPGVLDQLYELESRISRDAAFLAIAPWAHLSAIR
jgi:S-adenosylmethionine-dependent methyltransferase